VTEARPRRRPAGGQALIEFALMLPLLLILIINVVNFGGFFFAWITVENAARSGAQYMITGPATLNQPNFPGLNSGVMTTIQGVMLADTSSLRNPGNITIRVCYRQHGSDATAYQWGDKGYDPSSTTPCPSTFPNPPSDTTAEGSLYGMGWVDVSYKYVPPIAPGLGFPRLGLYATLPKSLVIHRQVVMRLMG
jgi:TadE-like protein